MTSDVVKTQTDAETLTSSDLVHFLWHQEGQEWLLDALQSLLHRWSAQINGLHVKEKHSFKK